MQASTNSLADDQRRSARILVVDDDHELREAVVDLLRSEGHTVAQVANGQEALRHLRNGEPRPHLVLLDLAMPVMNGWQFHRELQTDAALAAIPVVVVSGRRETEEAVPVRPDRFLRKPFDDQALLEIVRRHCGGRLVEWGATAPCGRHWHELTAVP